MNNVKPFSPTDAEQHHESYIPDTMIESINELLAVKFSGVIKKCTIKQDDIIERYTLKILREYTADEIEVKNAKQEIRREIFDNNWLDIEPIYRKVGWKVTYNKPGYNEDYPATFAFEKCV